MMVQRAPGMFILLRNWKGIILKILGKVGFLFFNTCKFGKNLKLVNEIRKILV